MLNDPYQNEPRYDRAASARKLVLVSPGATALAEGNKGLRVFNSSTATRTLRVKPVGSADDVTLSFPPGLTIEPCAMEFVYGATPTPADLVIHAYGD